MTDELKSVIRDYIQAFETLDPELIVPFYSIPCMFLAPGRVVSVNGPDAALGLVGTLVAQARSQHYQRTEIVGLKAERLAADLGSVNGVYVRFDTAGDEIASFGFTYIMRKEGQAWKIAVAVAHEV